MRDIKYYVEAAKRLARMRGMGRWFVRFGVIVGAVILFYLVWRSDFITSDRTVAFFTVILAGIAAIQWWTTHVQLQHLRLEQRAWLAALQPSVETLETGEQIRIVAGLKNTGRTPANVVGTALKVWILPVEAELSGLNTDDAAMERSSKVPAIFE